jgi:hypothetical protein
VKIFIKKEPKNIINGSRVNSRRKWSMTPLCDIDKNKMLYTKKALKINN